MHHGNPEEHTTEEAEENAEEGAAAEESGPDAADLDKDPAYNPGDENLKGIKGG